tara:strand:+ start:112 stop:471 length:360 start_codon:yes stop_codon:yes gene_type:complete
MIYEGSEGSVSGYYKKKKIISRPLGDGRTLEGYKNQAQLVLIQAMRDGNDLQNIKKLCIQTLKNFRYEELIKQPDIEERDFVLFTLLILIKLKVVEEDGVQEGLLVMGRKKTRRDCEIH